MRGDKSTLRSRGPTKINRAILAVLGWLCRDMYAANPDAFIFTWRVDGAGFMKRAGAEVDETRLRVKMEAMMLVMDVAAEKNLTSAQARARNQTPDEDARQVRRHARRKRSAKHVIESLTPDEVEHTSRFLAQAARTMAAERTKTESVFDYLENDVFQYLDEDSPDAQEEIQKLSHELRKAESLGAPDSLLGLAEVLEEPIDVGSGHMPGEQGVDAAPCASGSHEAKGSASGLNHGAKKLSPSGAKTHEAC